MSVSGHSWLEDNIFRSHKDVGYGLSTFGIRVVTYDPFRYSPSRLAIYGAIILGLACFNYKLYQLYSTLGRIPNSGLYLNLILLTSLSVTASGIHHFDNFWRIEDYFLSAWIYNGYFFILDIGILNWVLASYLAVAGLSALIANSSILVAAGSGSYSSRIAGLRRLYIHCFMIWSGQAHYTLESIFNFSTSANISILCEGWSAIALNLFILYHRSALEESPDAAPDVKYTTLSQNDPDDVSIEMSQGTGYQQAGSSVRRRSRDSEDDSRR